MVNETEIENSFPIRAEVEFWSRSKGPNKAIESFFDIIFDVESPPEIFHTSIYGPIKEVNGRHLYNISFVFLDPSTQLDKFILAFKPMATTLNEVFTNLFPMEDEEDV